MKSLRESVLNSLDTYADEDKRLVETLDSIVEEYGPRACRVIFEVISHLKLDPETAKDFWEELLAHHEEMLGKLERDVGLRTSLCDFLCKVNKTLENPMVVELHVFENHYRSHVYDYLTGLYSRGLLESILEKELARSTRHESDFSLLFLDIDNFKHVNDTYGHATGDECLAGIAGIIKKEIRTEDTAIRYGGEEVVIILPETDKLKAIAIGERIRRRVGGAVFVGQGEFFKVTLSGGLVSFPMDGVDAETLLVNADQALYQAKDAGKDHIVVFSSEKRRYLRVDFDRRISVKCIGFDDDSGPVSADMRNISFRGILFESDISFEKETKLQLKVHFENEASEVEFTGTVVRSEFNPEGRYDTGISFLKLENPAKDEISAYLKKRLEQFGII